MDWNNTNIRVASREDPLLTHTRNTRLPRLDLAAGVLLAVGTSVFGAFTGIGQSPVATRLVVAHVDTQSELALGEAMPFDQGELRMVHLVPNELEIDGESIESLKRHAAFLTEKHDAFAPDASGTTTIDFERFLYIAEKTRIPKPALMCLTGSDT